MGFFWNGEFKARTVKPSLKSRSQAILSTDYRSEQARSGAIMFARWNQENFFKCQDAEYIFGVARGNGSACFQSTVTGVQNA